MASNSTAVIDDGLVKPHAFKIAARAADKQAPDPNSQDTDISNTQRETGDEVNRFLLCVLVSESAKLIKARAEKAGEALPMTVIVRGVLRSYRKAAKEQDSSLAGPEINVPRLMTLNDKVLREEITRHTQERVKTSQARLAHANRLGDEARIKAEKEALEHAIAACDRLPNSF